MVKKKFIDMRLSTFIKSTEQSAITLWSIVHFLFGVLWYFIFFMIYKDKKLTKTQRKDSIIHSLIILFFVHLLWEFFEMIPFIQKLFNKSFKSMNYKGDSIYNTIFDQIFVILGFVVGYFIFKFK